MKIIIVDDDGCELTGIAPSEGEVVVETLQVEWNDSNVTHKSAFEAARDILSRNPDVVFLDHDLGYKSPVWGRPPETGKDVAHCLREQGFAGSLVGTSSHNQPYCDVKSGKVQGEPLSWLVDFVRPALTAESKV